MRHRRSADAAIDYHRARQRFLDPTAPPRIKADGEDIGTTPATCAVIPDALDVILLRDATPGLLEASED